MTYCKPFSFLMGISMGKWPDFEYRIVFENDHFEENWSFSSMLPRVANGRQGFPRSKGDTRDG